MKDYTEAGRAYLGKCEWCGLDYADGAGCDENLGERYLVFEHTDDNDPYPPRFIALSERLEPVPPAILRHPLHRARFPLDEPPPAL